MLVEDRLLLTGEITDPALRDNGLDRGWEITAIDGVPFGQWATARAQLVSASTPQYERVAAARQATRRFWFEPRTRTFSFRGPTGALLTLVVPLDGPAFFSPPLLVSGRAVGEFGYVAVNSLTGNVISQFESELGRWVERPGLVLDLRANEGGNSVLAHPIMARLIQQPARVLWPSETLSPVGPPRFAGPLAVLVGPITHSAAESLAHNLKDSGRGTFVGTPTAGSSGNGPEAFQTPRGVVFRLATRPGQERSVSGAETEGVGLAPHVVREQTYEDYLAGRDTVLEEAVDVLRRSPR